MVLKIESLKELKNFSKKFLKELNPVKTGATILALQGNLGSGKTAFVKVLGKNLGIKKTIISPTFIIMKLYDISYKNFKKLIHVDAYRLEKEKELEVLGWQEILKNPENLIAIEWPENVSKVIPQSAKKLKFKFVDEKTRSVKSEI
ncbi:MAG: tRNA (adenosine(37)-N6)-threonylcarbamoyltransferase complex ATPase subunit type 1 TsaE [Patescibacteria group bacterium]